MGKKTLKQNMFVTTKEDAGQQRHRAALGIADAQAYRVWCRDNGFGPSARKNWRQRRQEQRYAIKLAARAEAANGLYSHLCALGLSSLKEYGTWRGGHGLKTRIRMGAAQREQEAQTAQRDRADHVLHISGQAVRRVRSAESNPQTWIQAIFANRVDVAQLPSPFLKTLYALALAEKNQRTRGALEELLLAVCRRARPLLSAPNLPGMGAEAGIMYLRGLLALARRREEWQRGLDDWQPSRLRPPRLFGSLARHLLARYAVPSFLDRAWFEGDTFEAQQHQGWFLHVADGGNIRAVDVPIGLTKMAAHHVMRAPADFAIEAALRWGQVRGMGGADRLARAVSASLLADVQSDEPFWAGVIHWFVNHPDLDTRHVGPILDFIYNVKYVPQEVMSLDDEIEYLAPPEPGFNMKGRTPPALLRRVEEWHQQMQRQTNRLCEWPRLDLGEFCVQQQDPRRDGVFYWTIRELVCSRELEEEGRAMNNCVASYIHSCTEGRSSIWSLRVMAPDTARPLRVMTIEVDPKTREIVQARGNCNLLPTSPKSTDRLKLAPTLLRRWASQQGLSFGPFAL